MRELLELLPVQEKNLAVYRRFHEAYEHALSPYMSRIHPHGIALADDDIDPRALAQRVGEHQLCWWFILVDGQAEGSVWLERDNPQDNWATLGIFLLGEAARGRGLGRRAIELALKEGVRWLGVSEIRLHVRADNHRAISCYQSCGFVATRQFFRSGKSPMESLEMRLIPTFTAPTAATEG